MRRKLPGNAQLIGFALLAGWNVSCSGGSGGAARATGGATAGAGGMGGGAGAGGSSGAGGTGGSAAGASGTAGSDAGSADGDGAVDAWVANGCASSTAPASALISDFDTADGGVALSAIGRMSMSGFATGASRVESGAWHVTLLRVTSAPQTGTFAFDSCVDARAYDGIVFTLSGEGIACNSLWLEIVDTAHAATGGAFSSGSGPPDATPPRYRVPLPGSDGWSMTFRYAFNGSPDNEAMLNPATPTDPAKLVGLQFVFYGSGTSSCPIDITIDDVRFYKGGADAAADAPVDGGGAD